MKTKKITKEFLISEEFSKPNTWAIFENNTLQGTIYARFSSDEFFEDVPICLNDFDYSVEQVVKMYENCYIILASEVKLIQKDELIKLFEEVLNRYKNAESNVIYEMSPDIDRSLTYLQERIKNYKEEFNKLLNK